MARKLTVAFLMSNSGLPEDEARKIVEALNAPARESLKYFVFLTDEQLKAINAFCTARKFAVEFTRPDYTWSKLHRAKPAPKAKDKGKGKGAPKPPTAPQNPTPA